MQKQDKLTKIAMDFFNPETAIYKKVHGNIEKVFYGLAILMGLQVFYHLSIQLFSNF